MITSPATSRLASSGIKNSVSFGIKDSGLAHIFNVLRNQLYTDKIGAVVREYSANAYDANIEAGNASTPIRVTLPSVLEKTFKVRDFGRGLTQEDIHDIYCFYGESTKRQSNAYIGQLGLGSKSAFAYGDNFLINSYVDGVVQSYNAFIDPTGIGQIALLSSKATDEPSGVEICIAVKGDDCREFTNAVKRYLQFFKVQPEIIGLSNEEIEQIFEKPITSGDGWAAYKNVRVPTAVMGNIAYPIAIVPMKLDQSVDGDKRIAALLNTGLVMEFPIGDLDVAASREGLQYTEKTIKKIREVVAKRVDEMVADLERHIGVAKSEFRAKLLLHTMDDLVSGFYHIRQVIKKINFNGKAIINNYCDVKKHSKDGALGYRLMSYSLNWNGRVRSTANETFCADSRCKIVLNDMGSYNLGARNARHLASLDKESKVHLFTPQINNNGKVRVCKGTDFVTYATQLGEINSLNGFDASDFVLASSILIPAKAMGGSGASSKTARTGVLVFKPTEAKSYLNAGAWQGATIDMKKGSGIYIQVANYQSVVDGSRQCNSTLLAMISPFKGIDASKLIGVTGSQMAKLGDGWVNVFDAMKEEYEGFIQKHSLDLDKAIGQRLANLLCKDLELNYLNNRKGQMALLALLKKPDMIAVLTEFFSAISDDNNSGNIKAAMDRYDALIRRNTPNRQLVEENTNAVKIANTIFEDSKKLHKAFPLLPYCSTHNLRWADENAAIIKAIADYLNR